MGLFSKKNKVKKELNENKKIITNSFLNNRCIVCGEIHNIKEIKHQEYAGSRYLDGQKKISLEDKLKDFHCCKKCGYVRDVNEKITQTNIIDEIKEIVNSERYKNIKNDEDIPESLKTLLLATEIKKVNANILKQLNQFWLDYYTEKGMENKINEYLLKRIDEVPKGCCLVKSISSGELCDDFYEYTKINREKHALIHININAALTDLYRRSGQFDKARECINFAFINYSFPKNDSVLKKYYEYQLKLVDEENTKHI